MGLLWAEVYSQSPILLSLCAVKHPGSAMLYDVYPMASTFDAT